MRRREVVRIDLPFLWVQVGAPADFEGGGWGGGANRYFHLLLSWFDTFPIFLVTAHPCLAHPPYGGKIPSGIYRNFVFCITFPRLTFGIDGVSALTPPFSSPMCLVGGGI